MTAVVTLTISVIVSWTSLSLAPASAQTIVDKWASVPPPTPPTPKAVTVDPKTTALLKLDFMNQNCGKRPACVASLPTMKKLLADARAAKASVIYSIIANSTTADVMPDVAPLPDEPWVQSGPDKFINTDLAKILKDKGIQTVIVPGRHRTAPSSLPARERRSGAYTLSCRWTACRLSNPFHRLHVS
jgi:hypothetical protein